MKEAHVDADTNVTFHDVPIPELNDPHQILIKVIVAGCNPKDWKMPAGRLVTIDSCPNSGDDVAGDYSLSIAFLHRRTDYSIFKVLSLPLALLSMTSGLVIASPHYINLVLHMGPTLRWLLSGIIQLFTLVIARSKKPLQCRWHIIWRPSAFLAC